VPDFAIVDSHVHLYDVARLRYDWLAQVPKINRTYVTSDFDEARGPVNVDGIVFVEVDVAPGQHLAEADFVQDLAARDPRIQAIVAHAPLQKGPRVEQDLEALAQRPLVRGVRKLIQGAVDPSFCIEPSFLEAVRLLPRYGMTFDICVKNWAMTYALELARRCPDVTFVLDHIGKPDIRFGIREPWWTQIREMAALPNVVCKLSGVITEADHTHWSREEVKPYAAHCIESFGFDRVMYGSDWTVSELTHPYPVWVEILDEIVAGASQHEKQMLYRDTARRIYRLD
jgi:L-fuconolactonase